MDNQQYPTTKVIATSLGLALCGVETWLNAEHIAHVEGWGSSLVAATIIASIGAAAALPLAERASKPGQTAKAVGLVVFFLLMAGFSLGASVSRTGGKADGDVSTAQNNNARAALGSRSLYRGQKSREGRMRKARRHRLPQGAHEARNGPRGGDSGPCG